MAQGNTNQADVYKCLPCILFLVCYGFVASEEYYIVPSLSDPCCVDNCLTLCQFVNGSTFCSNCDDTTLIFAPGNHSLESDLVIEEIHSFSLFAELHPSTTQIICDLNATIKFRNVSSVIINGFDFIECSGNLLESVTQFYLTNSTFYNHPEVGGITLTIAESIAYLDRIAFLSITVKLEPDHTLTSLLPQENCTLDSYRILTNNSIVVITQNLFERSIIGVGAVISSHGSSEITIFNSTFKNNRATCCYLDTTINDTRCIGAVLKVNQNIVDVSSSSFEHNHGYIARIDGGIASFTHSCFSNNFKPYEGYNFGSIISIIDSDMSIVYSIFMNNTIAIIGAFYSNTSISYSKFIDNEQVFGITGGQTSIDYSTFLRNNDPEFILIGVSDNHVMNLNHNEFVNNTVLGLIHVGAEKVAITFNKFIGNKVDFPLVKILYRDTPPGTIVNNLFIDNNALYNILINSNCKPGFSLSLGSSRCIKCPKEWYFNVLGLVIAAFVAGILLVILMLSLNLTVAIGTLNGILFYANIVASNMDAYFPLSSTPNFATIFISWLNLDIGFDICFFKEMATDAKAMLQLAFPAYVISLVVIIIVVSEHSSSFARIIGKGDPVAVLGTMILLSYANLLKAVIGSISLLYFEPAYGSLNFNPTKFIGYKNDYFMHLTDIGYALVAMSSLILLLGFVYTALVFFWQWLIWYQDKTIFKWVRYQKLQHFMEPYHAPYNIKYRYWTGLLLIMRIIVFSVSAINFTRDPRVDFVSTIFVISCLIFFRAIVAKRLYKNMLLDVMETAIYFNLAMFAAFTWYSLDFGGNQMAVAYISIMIIFVLLLTVVVFHILRFTGLYKLTFVQQSFKWITSKLAGKKSTRENLDKDEPGEVDRLLLHEARRPYVSYSVVGMSKNEHEVA